MSEHPAEHSTPPALEQVLEAYLLRRDEAIDQAGKDAIEEARAARFVLAEFMRRYPQHAAALMEYAATASIVRHSFAHDDLPASESSEANAIVERGMNIAAQLLAARRAASPATMTNVSASATQNAHVETRFAGVLREAETRGLQIQQLAATTGLTVPLLMKLDRRLITFASIPRQIIERISQQIGHTAETVAAYLQGSAQFATNASFRADEAPRMPEQQNFSDAVKTDLTITVQQRTELLALTHDDAQRDSNKIKT